MPASSAPRATIAKVTSGTGTLPNDAGQVWREYDITPYTLRVTSTNRPEQAIVDWILRETGYEAWHSDPLGLLSANGRTLRVYHTPQMQEVVSEIVDRFVNTQAESASLRLRLITIGSPNWRAKMQQVLHPVPVQTQGVQAWLLSKEDAAHDDVRTAQAHRFPRTQLAALAGAKRPVDRCHRARGRATTSRCDPQSRKSGLAFSRKWAKSTKASRSSSNRCCRSMAKSIDAVVKCNIDQVEKLIPVMLDVPTPVAPRQRTEIQVPQVDSCRFAEKFHWPTDMVLVIGFGIVPTPTPPEPTAVKIPLISPSDHADLLVFVENRGVAGKPPSVTRSLPPACRCAVAVELISVL